MIDFSYQTTFILAAELDVSKWIGDTLVAEGFVEGDISYVFCDDEFLLSINKEFLSHDTFTDIISFDYTEGKTVGGDIFISLERVKENALELSVSVDEEIKRVMIHGVLHYMGYKDKSIEDKNEMRKKENTCLLLYKAN